MFNYFINNSTLVNIIWIQCIFSWIMSTNIRTRHNVCKHCKHVLWTELYHTRISFLGHDKDGVMIIKDYKTQPHRRWDCNFHQTQQFLLHITFVYLYYSYYIKNKIQKLRKRLSPMRNDKRLCRGLSSNIEVYLKIQAKQTCTEGGNRSMIALASMTTNAKIIISLIAWELTSLKAR